MEIKLGGDIKKSRWLRDPQAMWLLVWFLEVCGSRRKCPLSVECATEPSQGSTGQDTEDTWPGVTGWLLG